MDLTSAVGRHVHLQLKRGVLFIGAKDDHMGPLPAGPHEEGRPPPPPVVVDQLAGKLEAADASHIEVVYPNPVDPRQGIRAFIEADNVAAAWVTQSVVIATAEEAARTT